MEAKSINPIIEKAISVLGTQELLASACGVTQAAVNKWLNKKTALSVERAFQIEQATKGAISKEEIRPDFFKKVV